MDILNQVVARMNKEDIRHYKLYASRMEYSHDRKDIALFDHIRDTGESYTEAEAIKKFYPPYNRNAYYRLKHRLLQTLNKSLLLQYVESQDEIFIHALFGLYKHQYSQNNFSVARYYLKKAEGKAISIEYFEMLDIIYSEYIRLSNTLVNINPEEYIEKRKKNYERLSKLREIDQVLAAMSYRLKLSQNFTSDNSLVKMLDKTVKDFSSDKELASSAQFQFRVVNAVSRSLLQKHEYKTLEKYLLSTFKDFQKKRMFNKSTHDGKLEMITFIVNTLFKNKKYDESLMWADKLHTSMEEHNRLLYNKYLVFYTNALTINYSVVNPDKAIQILEEQKSSPMLKSIPFYEIFVYLNLAIFYFDKRNYDKSVRHIIKMGLLDSFKKADRGLKLKIAVGELIIRLELEEFDTIEYRMVQIKNDFKDLLKEDNFSREKSMIQIIESFNKSMSKNQQHKIYDMMKHFITKDKDSDSDVIKYVPWLKKRVAALGNILN
ncbi:MAG TPA: hypothetical protein DCQ93_03510 [Bacteroidetes bacterium]|nr:hypothetical protein [Bacteroidota bacterium]